MLPLHHLFSSAKPTSQLFASRVPAQLVMDSIGELEQSLALGHKRSSETFDARLE